MKGLSRHISREPSIPTEHDHSNGIPLISFSRDPTPDPSPYRSRASRSATQSEDEDGYDDAEADIPLSLRPLVRSREAPRRKSWFKSGAVGKFLFGMWIGWQVYVSFLVAYVTGLTYLLVVQNRFILWTGVYKFPYPVTVTWLQLAGTHFWLLVAASLTRLLAPVFRALGLSAIVAPSYTAPATRPSQYRLGGLSVNSKLASYIRFPTGVAGGGLFEFDMRAAWTVLPLAVIYTGKVVLSNVSYAYGVINVYTASRIGTVPLTLLLTSLLTRTNHSISTLSSTIIVTLNLFVACFQRSTRITWESIVAGIFSTLFVSLYPIILLRTHKALTTSQPAAQNDLTNGHPASPTDGHHELSQPSNTQQVSRAYWQTLHYTSLLSLTLLTPLVLLSGEVPNILRNCYFLDVPWFWFLTFSSSLVSFAIFSSTLALTRATSPLTVNFLSLPRGAFQIAVLQNRGKLLPHAWVGVALCWAGSVWYALVRREEGRRWEQRRMAGR